MPSQAQIQRCMRNHELNPWQLFLVGWRLIFSEIKWNLIRMSKRWEIKQLEKRLQQEKLKLADKVCMAHKSDPGSRYLDLKDPNVDLVLGQVAFLQEEIAHLQKELQVRRNAFLEQRRARYLGEE